MFVRHKPLAVDAQQFRGSSETLPFGGVDFHRDSDGFYVENSSGSIIRLVPGDWVLRQVDGSYLVSKAEDFERDYESV